MKIIPPSSSQSETTTDRRDALKRSIRSSIIAVSTFSGISSKFQNGDIAKTAAAEEETTKRVTVNGSSLASRLAAKDPSQLGNSVFNLPPKAQVYPLFMRGEWNVVLKFAGYAFPSKSIPKSKLLSNTSIPGFQKCSIASLADIGREETKFTCIFDPDTGLENRVHNFQQTINGHLGYAAIREVLYDASSNPNRISIDFIPNRTRNANRIELFCNARESELVNNYNKDDDKALSIFVCSEYIRQVTFGLSQEYGVARQVIGNYAQFWTWKQTSNNKKMVGNVLTVAYLDPQDPLFFQEPSKPVAVYSHDIVADRIDKE